MEPSTKRKGGKTKTKLYVLIRTRYEDVIQAERTLLPDYSLRQVAMTLELPFTTYLELRAFILEHEEEITQAVASSNWSGIENRLFSSLGKYQFLPSYQRALAQIEGASPSESATPQAAKATRARSRKKTPTAEKAKPAQGQTEPKAAEQGSAPAAPASAPTSSPQPPAPADEELDLPEPASAKKARELNADLTLRSS